MRMKKWSYRRKYEKISLSLLRDYIPMRSKKQKKKRKDLRGKDLNKTIQRTDGCYEGERERD